MRDDLGKALLPQAGEAIDPVELARRDQKKSLPRRFYKSADIERQGDLFVLVLDGKRAHTPARHALALPSEELARALAQEWEVQAEFIDPATMPLTRIANTAFDGVSREMAATAAEIVKYAGSDLLCYRAGEPATLVEEQSQRWNPILIWARDALQARFALAEGVMFVDQPPETLAGIAHAVEAIIGTGPASPLRAAALNMATTLTGSALLALALAHRRISAEEAWSLAHLDEDHQMRAWGADSEALARRERRWSEMQAAGLVLEKLVTQ